MKDDTISRQDAIDVASFECHELRGVFGRIEERLKALPSIQQEHGRWLSVKLLDDEADFGEVDGVQCSVCGDTFDNEYWAKTYFKYCPYCGNPMDEVSA